MNMVPSEGGHIKTLQPIEIMESTDGADDLAWFIAQLKPNGFVRAKLNLERQGFRTFMPLRETTVRQGRTVRDVLRPLFPGYIFVEFSPKVTQWRGINNTFGVLSLISGRIDAPTSVPPDLMKALLAGCDETNKLLPPEVFLAGRSVRVLSGPFKDFLAKVQQTSDDERVRLLLDLMGRAVLIDCAARDLELLD